MSSITMCRFSFHCSDLNRQLYWQGNIHLPLLNCPDEQPCNVMRLLAVALCSDSIQQTGYALRINPYHFDNKPDAELSMPGYSDHRLNIHVVNDSKLASSQKCRSRDKDALYITTASEECAITKGVVLPDNIINALIPSLRKTTSWQLQLDGKDLTIYSDDIDVTGEVTGVERLLSLALNFSKSAVRRAA